MSAQNTSREQQDSRIAEEAATWLEKLERAITRPESERFRLWLKTAAHREAIVERCKRWHGPEVLAVLAELIPVETFHQRVERHHGRIALAIGLGVSGIALMTVMFAVSKLWPRWDANKNPLRAEATFRTGPGERKTIQLPDGGRIVMNAGTKLMFSYMPLSRRVYITHGEASFDVKHDAKRPFTVVTGPRKFQVTEDGTVFNVRQRDEERIELTVMQGEVQALHGRRRAAPVSSELLRDNVSYGERTFAASEAGILGQNWFLSWPCNAARSAESSDSVGSPCFTTSF